MSYPVSEKSALVVNAHPADLIWRAGGAVALHALQGYQIHVVRSSFGECGESARLRRKGNMTEEAMKQVRREGVQAATEILSANVKFFDIGDYPLHADKETLFRLTDVYRRIRPRFVPMCSLHDPYNYDHPLASHLVQETRIIAQAEGYRPGEKIVAVPPAYCFEPYQPEQCNWKPDMLLDITVVWEKRYRAIQYMQGQEHLWEYYTRVAPQHEVQVKRNVGITAARDIVHDETFQSIFPHVTENLA